MQENLAVGYHQQDTDYYCGAACAQMVLDSIGAGILDQVPLYADNHSHSTIEPAWYTGPDGLTWTLNDRRPAAFGNHFVLFALTSEDLISRKIVWTIHHYQVAPVALVYGWQHWIVVRGYDASAAPSTYSDTSYSINAFDVNNPWPPTPSPAPPPPHTAGDACGGGGMRGIANEHITYATWQSTYMTGVPGGYWLGKFVAVCDPEPPPDWHGDRRPNPERRPRDRLLNAEEAAERAGAGLKEYGLHEREDWARPLEGAEPQEPVLVERLDRVGTYYYIVPMGRERGVSAAVSVDARFGDYLQAVALPEPGPNILEPLERKSTLEHLLDRRIELPERRGELIVDADLLCIYPVLVWKPCRESLSPFYPFRMITVGNQQLYVRSDGRVFTQLHDTARGI
jgi:hypothetical protein